MSDTDNKQGYWLVHDRKFYNKYEALCYATTISSPVTYNFFNDVWKSFDRTTLGKFTLNELYLERALRLRKKYDYLILYFSGGADSYNILRTFLDNKIPLDEVCVKWPKRVIGPEKNNIYNPNTVDNTAYNYLSEWDFAIKPTLDNLARNHPNIKINVIDWLDDRFLSNPEKMFRSVNHWHDIELPSLNTWSESEKTISATGRSVGAIYGVDKPYVYFHRNSVYMYFSDACTMMGQQNPDNPNTAEYFYWSPDFPILPFEMARRIAIAQCVNPELANTKYHRGLTSTEDGSSEYQAQYQIQQKKLRSVLYDNWTNLFQTLKPEKLDRSDKHSWIYKDPALKEYREKYHAMMDNNIQSISKNLVNERNNTFMYKSVTTEMYYIGGVNQLLGGG